jgi:hypothetical protein
MIEDKTLPGAAALRNVLAAVLVALVTTGCFDERRPIDAEPAASSVAPSRNAAPSIKVDPAEVVLTSGDLLVVTPVASDPENDPLSFEILGKPAWTRFDSRTGVLEGTPSDSDVGTYDGIVIEVSDGVNRVRGTVLRLVVQASTTSGGGEVTPPPPGNNPPQISGTPVTAVVEGQAYSFTPSASDPDGQSLTFSIQNKPVWASFSAATGQLAGSPPAGSYANIVISVSDGQASAALPAFTITVAQANRAPVITGTPATSVNTGQGYTFTPSAMDPDGHSLTFSIQNKPRWASFSTSNGRLSGTPASADVGVHTGIVISVSDGQLSASLPSFEIAVAQSNRTPTISGTPGTTAMEGQAYSFQPSASDPDGDTLSYSISNKPSWASFSTSTGRLSGTPGTGTAATYGNITISVSDGSLSASLPAFSITVQQVASGSATLSWSAPTLRTDGTPLSNLAGYRIHYGNAAGEYSKKVTINSAGVTTYVVENLGPGTWYFVTTAFDSTGAESDYSNVASKTIS